MSEFGRDRFGDTMAPSLLSVMGLTIVGILTILSCVIVAILIVPAVLVATLAARAIRGLQPQTNTQPYQTTIIEGEYEVLNPGTDKG